MIITRITSKSLQLISSSVKVFTNNGHVRRFASRRDDFINNRQEVQLEQCKDNGGLFILSLNRPTARNALGYSLINPLEDMLNKLSSNQEARVLIVRSLVDGVFCAGADLKERLAMNNNDVGPFVARLRNLTNLFNDLPFPTIAAIDGVAVGGGLEMALACDLRVASIKAKMGLVETKLAILPGAGGTQRLPRLIGLSKAKDLIFTGRLVDGEEAYNIGLVDYIARDDDRKDGAFIKSVALAQEILKSGPLGVRWAKFAINKGIEVDIHSGLAYEKAAYDQIIPTRDRNEGMKSFLEKRPPVYKGE